MKKLSKKEIAIRIIITVGLFFAIYGGYVAYIINN